MNNLQDLIIKIQDASFDEDIYSQNKNKLSFFEPKITNNINLTEDQIKDLLNKNDIDINIYLAKNPNLTPDQIKDLLSMNDEDINTGLALNPKIREFDLSDSTNIYILED